MLLDASPIFRFAGAGVKALIALGKYLGETAGITGEVQYEIERNAERLTALQNLPRIGWPVPPPLSLPSSRIQEMLDLKKAHPGSHPDSDLGEISTVLMAQEIEASRVIMDDAFGRKLARFRHIENCSTAKLAAEMVAAEAINEELGFTVFDLASPADVGRKEFQAELNRAA